MNIAAESLISTFKDRYPKYGRLQAIIFLATLNKNNVFNSISKYNEIILKYCDDDLMKELSNDEMNSIAWQIFLNSDDKKCLFIALNLTRQSLVIDKNNPAYLDTYANILYKLGQIEEAIEMETKALDLVAQWQKKSYQEALDKMKSGKPTW